MKTTKKGIGAIIAGAALAVYGVYKFCKKGTTDTENGEVAVLGEDDYKEVENESEESEEE